jgi:predicted TIM-barrel fold metal-dependent hydrolase
LTAVAAPTQPPIDWSAVEMAVLLPTTDAADQQNLELAAAMARAANDVQAAKWLDGDSRLRGSIVVAYEDADMAVEEIDRRAPDRRFVQLLLPPIAHAPFGDRRYWPMLAAAERHGLPICLTGEVASHLASLVFGGVFERLPGLRLLTVGTGCGWLPSLIWRLDGSWKLLKDEVPELTRLPRSFSAKTPRRCTSTTSN